MFCKLDISRVVVIQSWLVFINLGDILLVIWKAFIK